MSLDEAMNVGGNLRVGLGAGRRSMVTARPVRYVAGVALIAIGYDVFAQGGEALLLTGPAGAFWPATGVGIAVLYLGGLRWWPGVLLGDLLSREWAQLPLGTALAESAGNITRALVAAIILRRLIGPRAGMDRLAHVGAVLLAVGTGEAISATVAMVALRAGEVIDGSEMAVFWRSWWLGGVAGGLVVVPLALAWAQPLAPAWRGRRVVEGALMIAAVGALSAIALSAEEPLTYLVFPSLIWAALRFGPQGATLAVAVAVVAAVLATSNALGPFVEQAASDSALNLQLYIVFAALTTLCLAAIVCERRRVAQELSESRTRIAVARERERRRLEGELHDSAQNRIFALRVKLSAGTGTVRGYVAGARRGARGADRRGRGRRRRPAAHRARSLAADAGHARSARRPQRRGSAQCDPRGDRGQRHRTERAAHRAGGVPVLPGVDPERGQARRPRHLRDGAAPPDGRRAAVQRP